MSEKIKEFPNKKSEEEVSVLKASLDAITEAMPDLQGMEGMAALLSMPDEEFAIIAPPILMEMEKSLNNINDKLIEWRQFCQIIEQLPYGKELICYKKEN